MLSLQEAVQKDPIKQEMKLIEQRMDSYGSFHPSKASVLNVEKPALRAELQTLLTTMPLSEFLAKSGSTGIAGAAYMVPDKLHVDLVGYSHLTDKVPLFSEVVDGWEGGDLKVNIVSDATYKPMKYTSGGAKPTQTLETVQATLTPVTWGIPILITTTLIEDAAYGVIDYHIKQAAMACGDYATDEALTVLKTATDGVGTVNSSATGDADQTKYTGGATSDILVAWSDVGNDRFIADTLICTPEAWEHSISQTTTAGTMDAVAPVRKDAKYDLKLSILNLDVLFSTSTVLHDSADVVDAAFTACVSLVFDRNHALLTGRKRWLALENYSKPIEDLAGANVSCRQDSVTLYDDSIYVLTET